MGCLEDEGEASVLYLLINIESTDCHFFATNIEKVKKLMSYSYFVK